MKKRQTSDREQTESRCHEWRWLEKFVSRLHRDRGGGVRSTVKLRAEAEPGAKAETSDSLGPWSLGVAAASQRPHPSARGRYNYFLNTLDNSLANEAPPHCPTV